MTQTFIPIFSLAGNMSGFVSIFNDEIGIPIDYTQYVELFGGTLTMLGNTHIDTRNQC